MTITTEATVTYQEGDRVLVTYCEPGSPAFEKWSGPATVIRDRGPSISVLTDKGDQGAFAPKCIKRIVPGGFELGDEVIVLADTWPSTAQPGDYGRVTGTDGVYVLVDMEESGTTSFPFRPSEILAADVKVFEEGDEVEIVGAPFFATGAYDRAHGRYFNNRVERGQRATVTFEYGTPSDGEYIVRFGDAQDAVTTVSSKALQLAKAHDDHDEELAAWELELLGYATPEPESHGGLTVGDRVRFAAEGYDFDSDLFGREGEVVGFTCGGDFVTVLFDGDEDPTHGWFTTRYELVFPEPVAEAALIGATVEDRVALDALPDGSIIQGITRTDLVRQKIGDDWYAPGREGTFTISATGLANKGAVVIHLG